MNESIITYDEFCDLVTKHIKCGKEFYESLLINVIKNPSRYCGIFRLSNAKIKLMQNITQSNEIKFGDIVQELVTKYLEKLDYKFFDKKVKNNKLNIDQYFYDDNTIYIVEMKIRDDHDSTKKIGQYDNFKRKIKLIRSLHSNKKHLDASIWFVDDSLIKNKNYYTNEIKKEKFDNTTLHLYYGDEFFKSLKNGQKVWHELIELLTKYKIKNANNEIEVPDFGNSKQIFDALLNLSPKYWNKLNSNKPQFELLRKELFSSGNNFAKVKQLRLKI